MAGRNVINNYLMSSRFLSKFGLFNPKTRPANVNGEATASSPIEEQEALSESPEPVAASSGKTKQESSLVLCYIRYEEDNFEEFCSFASGLYDRLTGEGELFHCDRYCDSQPFVGKPLIGWKGVEHTKMYLGHVLVNSAVPGLKPLDVNLPLDILGGKGVVVKEGTVYVSSRAGLSHLRFLQRVLRSSRFSGIMTVKRNDDYVLLCRIDGVPAPDIILTDDEFRGLKYCHFHPEQVLFRHHMHLMISMHENKKSSTNNIII